MLAAYEKRRSGLAPSTTQGHGTKTGSSIFGMPDHPLEIRPGTRPATSGEFQSPPPKCPRVAPGNNPRHCAVLGGRFWCQLGPVQAGFGYKFRFLTGLESQGSFSLLVWVLPDHKRGQREVPDLPHAPAARPNSRTELNHQLRASSGRFWVQIPVLDGTGRLDGGGGRLKRPGWASFAV